MCQQQVECGVLCNAIGNYGNTSIICSTAVGNILQTPCIHAHACIHNICSVASLYPGYMSGNEATNIIEEKRGREREKERDA